MATALGHQGNLAVPDDSVALVDQTGFDLHHLVNDALAVFSVTPDSQEPEQDDTAFASSAPVSMAYRGDGLKTWTAAFEGRFPKGAVQSGHNGNVTFASGYVNKVQSFNLSLTCAEFDDTGMTSTPPTWAEFVPGLWSATGSYRARVDSATAVSQPSLNGSATFRLADLTSDATLAMAIVVTGVSQAITVGQMTFVDYTFRVNGDITFAGTTPLLPAGTITTPDVTEVNIRKTGSRIATGSCFMTALNIAVAIGQSVTVSGTLRGTGALTEA